MKQKKKKKEFLLWKLLKDIKSLKKSCKNYMGNFILNRSESFLNMIQLIGLIFKF